MVCHFIVKHNCLPQFWRMSWFGTKYRLSHNLIWCSVSRALYISLPSFSPFKLVNLSFSLSVPTSYLHIIIFFFLKILLINSMYKKKRRRACMEELRHFKIHHKTFKLGFENTTLLEIELEKFKPNYIFQIETASKLEPHTIRTRISNFRYQK